jgi:hypothetical protein
MREGAAHAVEMARAKACHRPSSVCLQGIDNAETIEAVHALRAQDPVSASLLL